jgi:hypothetical protein
MTPTDQLIELVMNDAEMERMTRPTTWEDRVAEIMDDGASRHDAEAIATAESEPNMTPIKVRVIYSGGLAPFLASQIEPDMLYIGNSFEVDCGEMVFAVKLQNSRGEMVTIFPERIGRYFKKGHSINSPALEMSAEELAPYLKWEASR